MPRTTKNTIYRIVINFFFVSTFVIGVASIVGIRPNLVGEPFGGFLTAWVPRAGKYQVSIDTPTSWPALASKNIRIGDYILAINGEPPTNAQAVYGEMANQPIDSQLINYTVERNGSLLTVKDKLYVLTNKDLIEVKMPQILLAFACWALSVIVFWAQPDREVNQSFAFAALASANCALMPGTTIFTQTLWGNTLATQIANFFTFGIFSALIGPAMMHFTSVFPELDNKNGLLYRLRNYWFIPAIPVILTIIYTTSQWQRWSPLIMVFDRIQAAFFGPFFVLGILFGSIRYTYLYFTTTSLRIKRQLSIIIFGWLIGFLLPAIPYIYYVITLNWLIPAFSDSSAFYMAILPSIAFSYAILRYQLFRSRNNVLSILTIAFVSIILAFVLSLLIAPVFNELPLFVVLIFTTLLTSLAWRTNNPIRILFSRLQERETTHYRVIEHFSKAIGFVTELKALPKIVVDNLMDKLESESAAFWLFDHNTGTFKLAYSNSIRQPYSPAKELVFDDQSIRFFSHWSRPLHTASRSIEKYMQGLDRKMQVQNIDIVLVLQNEGELIGLIALGRRWTEELFDDKDLDLLTILKDQITLAVQVAQQIAELRLIPQRVAETQEKERYRLARELHDTTQQFLGRLPFFLEVGRGKMRTDIEKADQILLDCLYEIQNAAKDLRDLRRDLTPGLLLERGFIEALREYANHFASRASLELDFHVDDCINDALDSDAKFALYRVIQQCIDNTFEHAKAKKVWIIIGKVKDSIEFSIKDDGVGFQIPDVKDFVRKGQYGLQFMVDRVTLLGGQLSIESQAGVGTIVFGRIPIQRNS